MATETSSKLFEAMRKLFPDLPKGVTKLIVTMSVDRAPTIDCTYLVSTLGMITEEHTVFHLDEKMGE